MHLPCNQLHDCRPSTRSERLHAPGGKQRPCASATSTICNIPGDTGAGPGKGGLTGLFFLATRRPWNWIIHSCTCRPHPCLSKQSTQQQAALSINRCNYGHMERTFA
jgi:hypothetical protein